MTFINTTSLKDNIQFPYKQNLSAYNGANNYELWNKGNITTTINNGGVNKTIYDPCNSGFRVPSMAAYSFMTTTGYNSSNAGEFNVVGSFNKGWYFKTNIGASTIFFPALGYIHKDNSTRYDVNTGCHYASATPYSNTDTWRPYAINTYIAANDWCHKTWPISVMPVLTSN